ncbi:hypothetical protein GQ53DRAFT_659580 [Thozetella sp. PMI_491]|nr:hypothetical protein GQ53DRAFT_659580 [Thozetella sp. PMI_491]
MLPDFRDDLAREAGIVTPGVDDTPHIQFAIEALTRDRDTGYSANASSSSGSERPLDPFVDDRGLGYYHPRAAAAPQHRYPPPIPARPPQAHMADEAAVPRQPRQSEPFFMKLDAFRMDTGSVHSADQDVSQKWPGGHRPIAPHEWLPVDRDAVTDPQLVEQTHGYGGLHARPALLRTPALFGLMALCLLMIAALVLAAVYSQLHSGLTGYVSTYGGIYFVFRILPQLAGAVVLLYAQCVVAAMFRILPFARLASRNLSDRKDAIFEDLYPKSFLWPQLVGTWQVWVPILVTWLVNFTIPLESALFTVILVNDVWVWAAVQGVAWTLVALYLALFVSTAIVWRYWDKVGRTGLLWDPRSLADVITMVSDTNIADDYRGTQMAGTRDTMVFKLKRRADDRLGYWTWRDGRPGFWYALGNTMDDANFVPVPDHMKGVEMLKEHEKQAAVARLGLLAGEHDAEDLARSPGIRYRYLPWCMRNNQLLYFVVTATVLLVALFVVSFLPATHVTAGFLPALSAAPTPGAFSAADFLYSFLPSLLGMVMFLLFQSLDQSLRILQPWAALANPRGAPAHESLLADYAACVPLQSAYRAFGNGHIRLAAVSFLSTLFILIPVVAGGVFMALTTAGGQVRMFPNVPAFSILLALLVLYLVGLVVMFPGRQALRLPHAVTCLAEMISFLMNDDLLSDPAFKLCRTRDEMLDKMGAARGAPESQPSWTLGFGSENGPDAIFGVRRVRRFTEKRKVRKSQIRRGARPARGTVPVWEA